MLKYYTLNALPSWHVCFIYIIYALCPSAPLVGGRQECCACLWCAILARSRQLTQGETRKGTQTVEQILFCRSCIPIESIVTHVSGSPLVLVTLFIAYWLYYVMSRTTALAAALGMLHNKTQESESLLAFGQKVPQNRA